MAKTEPRTLSGFMELLPDEQILFNQMKRTIEETYQKYFVRLLYQYLWIEKAAGKASGG